MTAPTEGRGGIISIQTPTRWVGLGSFGDGIERFEEFEKPGQMAMVPWIRAVRFGGSTTEYNVALLESITRNAP